MENTENAKVAANDIENMTLAQIKALKKRYKDEFEELIRKFFEERPLLETVELCKEMLDFDSPFPKRLVKFRIGKVWLDKTYFVSKVLLIKESAYI